MDQLANTEWVLPQEFEQRIASIYESHTLTSQDCVELCKEAVRFSREFPESEPAIAQAVCGLLVQFDLEEDKKLTELFEIFEDLDSRCAASNKKISDAWQDASNLVNQLDRDGYGNRNFQQWTHP